MSSLKYVDHTYRDFGRYVEEGGELIKHKKSGNNFPARLHQMLSAPEHSHVITWMPHGRAWKILDKERLISDVIPNYYVCKKYESFARQLNGWGFKRLHQSGPDFGCYYHECFLRDLPKLSCLIRRLPPNLGKSTPFAEGEPNFYLISEEYPLSGFKSSSTKETPRPRAASLDTLSLTLAQPPVAAQRGRSAPVMSDNITPKICNLSSPSIRPSTIQETPVPETMAPNESSTSMNPSNQTVGYFYPQSYSQHPPFSTNYTSIYNTGQYYDHYPIQGQPFSRGQYHPADPRSSFQFPHLPNNRPPIEDPSHQQYSGYFQESQQLNSYGKNYPIDVPGPSSLHPSGQKNVLDPFEPIPLSRSNSKKDSEVQVDKLDQIARPNSS
eukprot:CAMPEP_0172302126 /NCGR_PEP_ID=MMETSP1058-20130122/3875_1 /TAXON_ID=83371 /ORGANISM="Detonula confervacea, Strain CCMP 353" /LENGTH=381 /DNA_ID=CAMNT_0013012491 /DNA_START=84 /DNA_END=1229 /DNA_ORIENTATION=-